MPALLLLASALGLNYHRHRVGKSTICSTSRQYVGPGAFLMGWAALTAWIAPHYIRPFARAALAAVETFDDTLSAAFDSEETS
jgi:hypothetical protein